MKFSQELSWRGFANQTTLTNTDVLDTSQVTFYWGVDPSSDSMTIGNLATAMMVRHFIANGHKAILLVGGATGIIGDPDGKAQERELKSTKEIEQNKKKIIEQYKTIFAGQKFEIVDNLEWFEDIKYIDFLRDIGKHVPMRQMLGREFVSTRVGEGGAGISYAEFSYVMLQAYDFLHLYKEKGANLQLCGSDQWGNSIAGVDLIRRKTGGEAHVWSAPLVIDKSTGKKFGKSEAGAVWLDESKTTPYQFYQFWLNVDDESAAEFLRVYTLISPEEYDVLMREFDVDRSRRAVQKKLAYDVTSLIHGQKRAEEVKRASEVLFEGGNFLELEKNEKQVLRRELFVAKASDDLAETLVNAKLASSKREARDFLQAGAIFVNGQKAGPENLQLLQRGDNLLKRGKNRFAIVEKKWL